MPLLRYFVFVGGALLALLFVSDAVFPMQQLPGYMNVASSDRPPVRIHSDRRWPDRVVFDTSVPTVALPTVAQVRVAPPTVAAAIPPKARVREAFAQFRPSESEIKAGQEAKRVPMEPKAADAKPQPKRKIAKARPSRPLMLVAQQPHFGLFDTTW